MNAIKKVMVAGATMLASSATLAGNAYLTGHDILLHGGQSGYDVAILDYLREGIARADYDIIYINGGVTNPTSRYDAAGFGSTTTLELGTINSAAEFAAAIAGADAIVYPWAPSHTAADVAEFNSYAPEIAAFFNAGGDIFANSSINKPTYYDFLPPSAAASGPNLPGNPSSGFVATPEGLAQVGMTNDMMNGDPTHNTFTSFDPGAFTVMERYGPTNEIISLGLRGGTITDDVIVTDDIVTDDSTVPVPGTIGIMGLALAALSMIRRRRSIR